MPKYGPVFAREGIDGVALIKKVDVAWMESHGIPHDIAAITFE